MNKGSLLLVLIIVFVNGVSCSEQKENGVDMTSENAIAKAASLAGNNEHFFVKNVGIFEPNLYVHNEEVNNLHSMPPSEEDPVYSGKSSGNLEIIFVDQKKGDFIELSTGDFLQIESGLVVFFAPKKIYILDFDKKEYMWYLRETY